VTEEEEKKEVGSSS